MREYNEHVAALKDDLSGSFMSVAIQYAYSQGGELSIESYELEGTEVAREYLVDRFGEQQVKGLEEDIG